MGKFDDSIGWLRTQMANAMSALADLKSGHKIEFNDKDVTQEWVSTYERIIAQCKRLIGAYEDRND